MPVTNPRRIFWTHDGERVDGSTVALDGLAYQLYADGEVVASFPGALNAEGQFEQLFADLAWTPTPGAVHRLELTAIETATGLESAPSHSVEAVFVGKPNSPAGFGAD